MRQSQTRIGLVVVLAAVWQGIVFVLSSWGILGVIYLLLGIPWNATGWINVGGTTIGLVVLELPIVLVSIWLLRRPVQSPDEWLAKLRDDQRHKP